MFLAISPYSKAELDEAAEEVKVRENIGKAKEASKTDDEVVQRLLHRPNILLSYRSEFHYFFFNEASWSSDITQSF